MIWTMPLPVGKGIVFLFNADGSSTTSAAAMRPVVWGWYHPKLRSAYLGFSEVPPLRGFYCGYAAGYRLRVIGYGLILVVFLCSPPALQPPGIYRRQMLVTPQKGRQTSLRMILSTLQVYGW